MGFYVLRATRVAPLEQTNEDIESGNIISRPARPPEASVDLKQPDAYLRGL